MLTIYGGTGANQLGLLSETIQETLSVLKRDGITPKELENSKEQMKGSLMLSLESTNSKMSRNGKNELLLGKHKTMDEIITELNAVSLESVNSAAAYLRMITHYRSSARPAICRLHLKQKSSLPLYGQAFLLRVI